MILPRKQALPMLVCSLLAGAVALWGGGCAREVSAPAETASSGSEGLGGGRSAYDLLTGARPNSASDFAAPVEDPWQKGSWTERVVHLLRGGRGLSRDALGKLLSQDKAKIIDVLMEDPLFGDTVLDFNLYFLGGKPDFVADERHASYNPVIYDYPQAIRSARETLKGGDYLALLDYGQPMYVSGLAQPYFAPTSEPSPGPTASPTLSQLRQRAYDNLQKNTDGLLALALKGAPLSELCPLVGEAQGVLSNAVPSSLTLPILISPDWYGPVAFACLLPMVPHDPLDLVAEITKIKAKNIQLIERLTAAEPTLTAPDDPLRPKQVDIRDIVSLDLGPIGKALDWSQFSGAIQARTLVNSSTNYDRKRAAYVLKRYFCDDLTPIAVENPVVHAQDKHGSDPACLSCHYKLDPMAGFFRDRGLLFKDFGNAKTLVFDDFATADHETYVNAWKGPAGASGTAREWNIGYIRSINNPKLNDYGQSMEDLFAIIRRAPEVRSCLVRRMFEYLVGEDRLLDAGYLDSLTQDFNRAVKAGTSAAAFKATVKRILLSNSFAQVDPEPGRCYDFAPGAEVTGAPPCSVAFTLQKNCAKCHGSVDPEFGNLDLAHWVRLGDGESGFPYLDTSGKQRPRADAFKAILERLGTSDPERRMPKNSFMSSGERDQLYRWATQEVGKAQ